MDPKLFQEVPLNTFEPNPCSPPAPEPSWRGVTINAPTKVSFQRGKRIGLSKAFAAIPICGLYRLDVPFPLVEDDIQLFALDKRSGKLYSGRVVELDPSPEIPRPPSRPLTREDVQGLASGRYFNPNLADFVRLPEAPGAYDVWVEVRGVRSNTVKLEVVQGALKR